MKPIRLILIPLVVWAIGCDPEHSNQISAPNLDVSTISVTSLSGRTVKLSAFKGKVLYIDFWAPWCTPCLEGLPFTQRLSDAFKDKGLAVVAISTDPLESVAPFMKSKKYTFGSYLDTDGSAAHKMSVVDLPHTLVIGRDGKVIDDEEGAPNQGDMIKLLAKAGIDTTGFVPKDDANLQPNAS